LALAVFYTTSQFRGFSDPEAMDAGQLPLDQLLAQYRRGADLLNFCRGRLESVEQQVKVLEGEQLKPWAAS
jgi:exodeoxyribonuclease VII small subunit